MVGKCEKYKECETCEGVERDVARGSPLGGRATAEILTAEGGCATLKRTVLGYGLMCFPAHARTCVFDAMPINLVGIEQVIEQPTAMPEGYAFCCKRLIFRL